MKKSDSEVPEGTASYHGAPAGTSPVLSPQTTAARAPTRLEIRALAKLLQLMGNPPLHFVLWNGEVVARSDCGAVARLHLHDRRTLWQLLLNPELYFGEAYTRGSLDVEGNLVECLEAIYRAMPPASSRGPLRRRLDDWANRARSASPASARHNIHHHYDLGNDFFRLWLDQEMQYTCAYFASADLSLEQAQLAKMDYVCRKLRLQPGETVIEAGCGWGSLALYMAQHYGVRVRAWNISREQIRYARERAAEKGLSDRVEFIEDDYRNIDGGCDAFVSVGMLEHVGRLHYATLGAVIDRCLAADGRGLIHSIGRDHPYPLNAWIRKRIFPAAYPPSLREMMDVLEPWGFSVLDVENLRLHYARTLRDWLERFEAHSDEIRERYDESFVRSWRLYLAGSLAGFDSGWLQLFQIVFTRTGMNDIPWTRAQLYR
ncbi:MAG TPA: class I SAM-dependent methyltransferase, partial [Gammaproteobacteria bacterium]|nr:class I SAM-dependent methyltransferase [Gammaproteobacteria bacterium]